MTSSLTPKKRRVAVIGGGISGLAAAHRLVEQMPDVQLTLLEASDQLGGVLQTVRRDGYLIEQAADNFITNLPWGVELCRRVGLGDQLLETNDALRRAFVVRRGQLHEVPRGFVLMAPKQLGSIVTTPILSPLGKLRLAYEYFVPREAHDDESVAAFVRRRLGKETFERLVEPLVGGIYTADSERLSLAAALPQFREMEQKHGGLIRATRAEAKQQHAAARQESGARYSMFMAPRDGMQSLVQAVAQRLPAGSIRLATPVTTLRRTAQGSWQIVLQNGETLDCDAVILAMPAPRAGELLREADTELAASLASIEYASSAVVTLAYRRDQIAKPLEGFGFVVPAIEKRRILAGSFASLKFPGRAPEDQVLVRVFIGGALQPELVTRSDDELEQIAHKELAELIGAEGTPAVSLVTRWIEKMPQYHIGHLQRIEQIESRTAQLAGLALAGNAYRGVGIPQCIRSGEAAAQAIFAQLEHTPV